MKPRAVIFDAYGTLFDVHSVVARAGQNIAGDVEALSQLWRQKQLERTWLRGLMERYQDFWQVTGEALHAAAKQLGIDMTASQSEALTQAYLTPGLFADARPALAALHGMPRAILSNGTPKMLEAAVSHAEMESEFAAVISVDRLKIYKPSPRVYALGPEILQLAAGEILFVSSNWWDAAGAKAFGYQVCWCNRGHAPAEDLGFAPDLTVYGLDEIARGLGRL